MPRVVSPTGPPMAPAGSQMNYKPKALIGDATLVPVFSATRDKLKRVDPVKRAQELSIKLTGKKGVYRFGGV